MLKQLKVGMHRGGLQLKKAAPTICTILAAGGVIGTAVLAALGTKNAIEDISKAKESNGDMNTSDKAIIAIPHYVPAAGVGVGTIILIFASNNLNKQQQASLASAYALLDKSYKQLREAVIKTVGEEKFKEIKDEIVRMNCEEPRFDDVDEGVWFYDPVSHRNFVRPWDEMNYAIQKFIECFEWNGHVDLNTFYDLLDLPETEEGMILFWDINFMTDYVTEGQLHFDFEKTVLDGGNEVYTILYPNIPEL